MKNIVMENAKDLNELAMVLHDIKEVLVGDKPQNGVCETEKAVDCLLGNIERNAEKTRVCIDLAKTILDVLEGSPAIKPPRDCF